MDITELLERAPWDALGWQIGNGEHPSNEELAAAFRQNRHITAEMASYVADRMDGSIKRPARRGARRETKANQQ